MKYADVVAVLRVDLASCNHADAHELSLNPALGFVGFGQILTALSRMRDEGEIELVDPSRSIAAGGKLRLIGGEA